MQHKAKILIVGPPESGKSSLANFLSDAGDVGSSVYRPTKGCRIVEFGVPNIDVNGIPSEAEVELWDVSGDKRYANCWPAIQRGTNGVTFVYNPGKDDHPKYLESLHTQFVSMQGVRESQCIVFCHNKPDTSGYAAKLPSVFSGITQVDSEFSEEGSGRIRQDFLSFLSKVLSHMSDVAEKNENMIIT